MLSQPQAQRPQNFFGELAEDNIRKFEQWRVLHRSILTDAEIYKMQKIHKIYQSEVGGSLPIQLDLVDKEKDFFFKTFKFKEAKLDVMESDFETKVCIARMGDANGAFRFQAEEIVKICCQFQIIKKERHITSGFMTDPENLFCEEIKAWATSTYCNLEANEINKGIILKRVRYLEEILCEDDLFDRPDSRITHTIQQVIVAVRGVLKYHTIPMIDKKLIHADAGTAFEEMMKHIVIIIADTSEILYHVFRGSPVKANYIENDQAMKLLKAVLQSPDVSNAMMTHQSPVLPHDNSDGIDYSKPFLDMLGNGRLFIHENYVYPPEQRVKIDDLLELHDVTYQKIFADDECGLEVRFRKNVDVTKHFLKAHYFLLSLGRLYSVLEKAKDCALTGGTLLVYGIANAQLNALLELSDSLINSLNNTVSALMCCAETRFGELVYTNSATVLRCPWIGHYKLLPSLLVKFEKRIKQLMNELAKMRTQANSMTLYEQFQKAQTETNVFLSAAHGFSERMAEVLNIAYSTPTSKAIVNVPQLSQIQNGLLDEVQGFPAITNTSTATTISSLTATTAPVPVPVTAESTTANTKTENTATAVIATAPTATTATTATTTAITTAITTATTATTTASTVTKSKPIDAPVVPKLKHRDSFEVRYVPPEVQTDRSWRGSQRRSLMSTRVNSNSISASSHRDSITSHNITTSASASSVPSLLDGDNSNNNRGKRTKRLVPSKTSGRTKSLERRKSHVRVRTGEVSSGGSSANNSPSSSTGSQIIERKKASRALRTSSPPSRGNSDDDSDSDSESDDHGKPKRFSLTARKQTIDEPAVQKKRSPSSAKSSDDEGEQRSSRSRNSKGSPSDDGSSNINRSGNRKLKERSRSRSRNRNNNEVRNTESNEKSVKMDVPEKEAHDTNDNTAEPKTKLSTSQARKIKF